MSQNTESADGSGVSEHEALPKSSAPVADVQTADSSTSDSPPAEVKTEERPPAEPVANVPRFTLADLALPLVTLCVVSVSIVLFFQTTYLTRSFETTFLTRNTLPSPVGRYNVLLTIGVGILSPLLIVAGLYAWKRARLWPKLEWFARLVAPLALLFVLPALFNFELGQAQPLQYLMILSGVVLALRKLLIRAFEAWDEVDGARLRERFPRLARLGRVKMPRVLPLCVVLLAATAYAVYVGYFTILQHRQIQTTAFDLGIYDNLMFNALNGRPFRSPILFGPGNYNYLAGHAELAMLLFVPLYAIKPGPETLLVIQAFFLAFAALPLFLTARTRLSQGTAMLLALGYLLFAPLHGPNFYDFHWLPISIFFNFWLYYALATKKNWLAVIVVLILFLIREDVAVGLAIFGLFLFLTKERARFGLILALVSAVWFVLDKFVLMKWAGEWWFENMYAELFADGKPGYGSVIVSLVTNPVYSFVTFLRENKLVYALHMTAALAFLPIRRLPLVLLLVPGSAFTLMTTGYWPTVSISFQYTSHWIPYLFLATILSLWLMKSEPDGAVKFKASMLVLVLALLSHSYNFGAILQRERFVGGFFPVSFEFTQQERKRYVDLKALASKIPPDVSVLATEFMSPHVSTRKESYVFRYDYKLPDYIFVSSREVTGDVRKMLNETFKKAEYGLVATTGNEFYLFKRGLHSPETKKALKTLGLKSKDDDKKH